MLHSLKTSFSIFVLSTLFNFERSKSLSYNPIWCFIYLNDDYLDEFHVNDCVNDECALPELLINENVHVLS